MCLFEYGAGGGHISQMPEAAVDVIKLRRYKILP